MIRRAIHWLLVWLFGRWIEPEAADTEDGEIVREPTPEELARGGQ